MPRRKVQAQPLPVFQPSNYSAAPAGPRNQNQDKKSRVEIRNAANSSGNPELYIYGDIAPSSFWFDSVGAQDVIDALAEIGDVAEIDLRLNSPGGSMFEGVAIYNALVRNTAKVNVYVDALAASAASFIAQAGDTVTMSQGSMMMIHDASTIVYGNAEEMRETADLLDKSSQNIADLYASRTGQSADFWRTQMKAETWYGAQEAVDAGLADRLAGTATEDPENHWDLRVFNYAGRSKAPSPTMKATKEPTVADKDDKTTPAFSMTLNGKTYTDQEEFQNAVNDLASKQTPPTPAPAPAFSMKIGEVEYTDLKAYQNAVNALQTFQAETKVQNRKDFVANLVSSNKILASAVGKDGEPGVEAFALSLSDEQFASWQKTWDAAPTNSLLGKHGGQTEPTTGDAPVTSDLQDKIDVAKATVKQHRVGGMKDEAIKNTDSYKFLVQHNAL